MSESLTPETRFSDRVQDYMRSRPGYPVEILDVLRRDAGLGPESVVADIGSGTGIFTALILPRAAKVFAVEPNPDMRGAAERLLAEFAGFQSVAATAQNTTLPDRSVDLIVAAQAFHWFNTPETRAEFSHILKPGGKIVLIWNERKLDATPFLRDFEALLLRFGTDYGRVRHENIDLPAMDAFFRGPYAAHFFANEQRFDFDGLKSRLLSASYAPGPRHPEFEPMLDRLRDIFDTHEKDGRVTMEYRTAVYIGE